MPSSSQAEPMPPEALLADYPRTHAVLAERLRSVVMTAVPDAIERVRPGWRLIGYDLPLTSRGALFAWVWLEPEHVHLGFPRGVQMADPDGVLQGAGITKLARWLTYAPGDRVDVALATRLVLEAARVALVPHSVA